MREFLAVSFSFPVIVWSLVLLCVLGFWALVVSGAVDHDGVDGGVGGGLPGFGGVPVVPAWSVLVVLTWLLCLLGALALGPERRGGGGVLVLVGAPVAAWGVALPLVRLWRRYVPAPPPVPSLRHFVGLTCTIRTGRVDERFGQAEVAAADGSTALVQVRQYEGAALRLGSTGLLYAYDEAGAFFWVAPFDACPDPAADPAADPQR
ncbi:hypothetical protein AB0J21_10400 [Streptomyces sp. NPDC049954]|uniref:hypothetical protein n=1 Tax=Streptomyces sp. NPDC049954 TaxID=3155779 RepID=UPI003425A199